MPENSHVIWPGKPTEPELPEPPVVPPPPPPAPVLNDLAPLPLTYNSPYLNLGDYPRKAWEESLLPDSPLRDELDAIIAASAGLGILARETALKESSDGTNATARQSRNPMGLMVRSESEPYIITGAGRKLRVFASWADAFREYKRRLTDPSEAYLSVGVKTLGELIERYLMGWIPGNPNRPIPPAESAANLKLYKEQVRDRANSRIEQYGRVGGEVTEPIDPPGIPNNFREWTIPGLPGKMVLPKDKTVEIILTPPGVHRPNRKVTITGSTLHETGNRGATAGARMHSNWQDGCTQGHPNGFVGVSMYVENNLVIVKIPFDEASIHSGDWRNNAHPSMEVCVNASRNAEQTEDTAMWVQANILRNRNQNAVDHLYPHSPSGCPAIINSQGRWKSIERGVDDRIAILDGAGPVPPTEEYATAIPVPREWDGTDWTREDGHVFVALQRVFVTKRVTSAHQSADPSSPKVRRDLPKDEAFLAYYATAGNDGKTWLVSQYGSRILADDCLPSLTSFASISAAADRGMGVDVQMVDPLRGLDATDVALDAPPVDKGAFMKGRG